MITENELTEAFDKALIKGPENLDGRDRQLYLIQDFILEWENGAFTGYLYNKIPDWKYINETISAMKTHGLTDLSNIVKEAVDLFQNYEEPYPTTTWSGVLKLYDPSGKLQDLDGKCKNLTNYGIH